MLCATLTAAATVGEPVWEHAAATADEVRSLIRVQADDDLSRGIVRQAVSDWDVAAVGDSGRSLDLVVTASDVERLIASGISFDVLVDDMVRAADGVRASYHTLAQYETLIAGLAASQPTITQLTSIGQTYEGRDIWCLEISDNPGVDESEPGVVFMGLHHAREWPSLEAALDVATRLVNGYGSDPEITALVNGQRIWVLPCVNPDGYVYSHDQGHDWRKNRSPQLYGEFGVDINRNYGGSYDGFVTGEWGSVTQMATSHNPGFDTYCGAAPFSELETQAIRDFMEPLDVSIAISYHTFSRLVLWPWGYSTSATPDDVLMSAIGTGIANAISQHGGDGTYNPQQSHDLYATTGGFNDWFYGYRYYESGRNVLPYTIELCSEFQPSQYQLQRVLNANWEGALYALNQAANVQSQLMPWVSPPVLTVPPTDLDGNFTISWQPQNPGASSSMCFIREYAGLSVITDDAEAGGGAWTLLDMSVGSDLGHSGTHSIGSSLLGPGISGMTSAPLQLAGGDELTFWAWYDITRGNDAAFVEVTANGRTFDILEQFTGSSGGWVQRTYDLSAYAGQWIQVRFRNTASLSTSGSQFYVDDIYPVASWGSISTLAVVTSGTSYDVTGRSPGDYYYQVRGWDSIQGSSGYGELQRVRVLDGWPLGDCDCDGSADVFDIDAFVLAITEPATYAVAYPGCDVMQADCDQDGTADVFDIDAFVAIIAGQ
ncbi:MAG: hypothetical protein JXO22_05170 [Phycisphaerae bacterium]|nr:hypothetical protein [Phycisphaerae bacterium]